MRIYPAIGSSLSIEKYKEFWQRFDCYELPQPENQAVEGMLTAAASAAGVEIEGDLAEIARTNDQTFGNPVANLERLKNEGERLSIDTFQPTLGGSWQRRYQTAKEQYGPIADYLYDSVDLLRQLNVSLTEPRVLIVARIVSGQRGWRNWWQSLAATQRTKSTRCNRADSRASRWSD